MFYQAAQCEFFLTSVPLEQRDYNDEMLFIKAQEKRMLELCSLWMLPCQTKLDSRNCCHNYFFGVSSLHNMRFPSVQAFWERNICTCLIANTHEKNIRAGSLTLWGHSDKYLHPYAWKITNFERQWPLRSPIWYLYDLQKWIF